MLGSSYYHGLIKKYVAVFGTLFNNITISRTSSSEFEQYLKVPIAYGPRDKFLARLEGDPSLNKPVAIVLPRMAFEIRDIRYAADRKLPSTYFKRLETSSQYVPVPYDIDFELSIMAKNSEDATKIVEQILPFFTPDFTPTVHLIPEMETTMDIPIILRNIQIDDQYEGNFEQRRSIIWTLQFTMKGYMFGPIRGGDTARPVIKFTETNFTSTRIYGDPVSLSTVNVRPGLTANGEPTSNTNTSINYIDINVSDNFGYITTIDTTAY